MVKIQGYKQLLCEISTMTADQLYGRLMYRMNWAESGRKVKIAENFQIK